LPSDIDKDFHYGLSTQEINMKNDPLWRSNAILEQRIAKQERQLERNESKKPTGPKKLRPIRPTVASLAHSKYLQAEAPIQPEFKMKRFAQIEHGKIDTGNRKQRVQSAAAFQ
jgi:hypothetical protein